MTNGIILGNQTLVLQAVNTSQAGLYTCVASNVVADGESNALHLDIKCKLEVVFVVDVEKVVFVFEVEVEVVVFEEEVEVVEVVVFEMEVVVEVVVICSI